MWMDGLAARMMYESAYSKELVPRTCQTFQSGIALSWKRRCKTRREQWNNSEEGSMQASNHSLHL